MSRGLRLRIVEHRAVELLAHAEAAVDDEHRVNWLVCGSPVRAVRK
jgi:hypothetical protein